MKGGHVKLVKPTGDESVTSADIPSPDEEISSLIDRAQSALRSDDYEKALRYIRAALEVEPNNPRAKSVLGNAEDAIRERLREHGILHDKVPRVIKPIEEISDMNFQPNEGFILSRIDGHWDIGSIIKISPMRELDGLLIFRQLRDRGVIILE